jgi:IS4 transposase
MRAKRKSRELKRFVYESVTYKDDKERIFQFICNNFEITAKEVAFLYKKRWSIELVFKKLKRNFQLHYFTQKLKMELKRKSGVRS